MHGEGVQLQRGGFRFFPCPSSFCSVTARLLCERATTGYAGSGEGEGRSDRDVSPSTLPTCSSASTTPVVSLANGRQTDSSAEERRSRGGWSSACVRLLLPFSSTPFVSFPGIHAHDSYPCAAHKSSHEANGTNRRKVPCPRRPRPSPGHLDVRGRLPWS